MMLLSSGKQLELHLENFMNFTWKASNIGKYATDLNILYYSLKRQVAKRGDATFSGVYNEHQLEYLKIIRF